MSLRDRAILTAAEAYASALVRLKLYIHRPDSTQYERLFKDVIEKRDRLVMLAARRAITHYEQTLQRDATASRSDQENDGQGYGSGHERRL